MPVARPFLKWVGGKRHLASTILTLLPETIDTYYEPFLGGGAVFFALAAQQRVKHAVLSDVNGELIKTYMAIQDDVEAVIQRLATYPNTKDFYLDLRAQSPFFLSHDACAARMIYLNRTCFNGLYRVNRDGIFNVPYGDNKRATICDGENLRLVSRALQGVELVWCPFETIAKRMKSGDVVYIDPPYASLTPTSFTAYQAQSFDDTAQCLLAKTVAKLTKRGVYTVVSNSPAPLVYKLYASYTMAVVQSPRRVNCDATKRGVVDELLIYPKERG